MRLDYEKLKKFWADRAKKAKEGNHAVNLGTTSDQSQKQLETLKKHIRPSDQKAIDLGCGLGRISIPLSELISEVTSVDFSEEILSALQENIKSKHITNITPICGACFDQLPVDYGTYDLAIIFGVLLHLNDEDVDKTVKNTFELLVNGGRVILRESVGTDGHFEVDKYSEELKCNYKAIYRTPEALEDLFKKHGFTAEHSEKLYQQRKETGTWFWVFKKTP